MIGVSLKCTDTKVLGFDKGIILGFSDGKVLVTILVYVDGITLEIDVGTKLGSLGGSFDGSNNGNIEGLFIVDSMGSSHG